MVSRKKNFYWWRGTGSYCNFGDAANVYLIKKLFNIDIHFRHPILINFKLIANIIKNRRFNLLVKNDFLYPWQKCYICIGSILNVSNNNCIVWGSGFMNFNERVNGGHFLALRGNLSAESLKKQGYNISNIALGDPALLLPIVYNKKVEKQKILGLIPHHTEIDYFQTKYAGKYLIIDLRTDDIEHVIDLILSCSYVLSTSLHGLITAHAYNIPAIWIQKGYIHTDGFKFYDYFSSVGIEFYEGLKDFEDILDDVKNIVEFFQVNEEFSKINKSLLSIQKALLDVTPFRIANKDARNLAMKLT